MADAPLFLDHEQVDIRIDEDEAPTCPRNSHQPPAGLMPPGRRADVLNRRPLSTDDALWDARDVAEYFRASRSWVYHQAEAGLLPYVRVGGLLRFDPKTIRAFAVDSHGRLSKKR
jgi:hypothetical protein